MTWPVTATRADGGWPNENDREPMKMPLSTHFLTLFYKCVAAFFGPMLLMGAIVDFRERDHTLCIIETVAAVAFMHSWWTDWRSLKHVVAREQSIEVSNYLRSIRIPYAQVEAVAQNGYYYRCIDMILKEPCPFGKHIVFMPYTSFPGLFRKRSPALDILLERIRAKNDE